MTDEKIIWDENYSVFSRKIDEQHQKLFNLINSLADQKEDMCAKDYARLLSKLTDYLIVHFETEIDYLKEIGYPKLAQHLAEHRRFIYVISNYNFCYKNSSVIDVQNVYLFLKRWLINHELGADMDYKQFLLKKMNGM